MLNAATHALDSSPQAASNESAHHSSPTAMPSEPPREPSRESLSERSYCYIELSGRLLLSHVDVGQRAFYLASRLALGLMESALRGQILHKDEARYMAELVELEAHAEILADACSEGWGNILHNFVDDVAAAQLRCLEQVFGVTLAPGGAARLLPHVAPGFARFGRDFAEAMRERRR